MTTAADYDRDTWNRDRLTQWRAALVDLVSRVEDADLLSLFFDRIGDMDDGPAIDDGGIVSAQVALMERQARRRGESREVSFAEAIDALTPEDKTSLAATLDGTLSGGVQALRDLAERFATIRARDEELQLTEEADAEGPEEDGEAVGDGQVEDIEEVEGQDAGGPEDGDVDPFEVLEETTHDGLPAMVLAIGADEIDGFVDEDTPLSLDDALRNAADDAAKSEHGKAYVLIEVTA